MQKGQRSLDRRPGGRRRGDERTWWVLVAVMLKQATLAMDFAAKTLALMSRAPTAKEDEDHCDDMGERRPAYRAGLDAVEDAVEEPAEMAITRGWP